MRRLDNMWEILVDERTIELAAKKACQSRRDKVEVAAFLSKKDELLFKLRESLVNHSYRSSKYRLFEIHERDKTRIVADLPLYPDRIAHWAIALAVEDKVNRKLIDQTHASRPGHGTHSAISDLRNYLDNDSRIKYALQIDVKKFFPSMDKAMVKARIREIIKDSDIIWILDKIIDEYELQGIAIGNRISPMIANAVLSPIDHLMKEKHHVHYYVRYMDDIVILGYSKPWLHHLRHIIEKELNQIGLEMKGNYQIYPIESRGIQFVGYRLYKDHTKVRKNIKNNLKWKCKRIEKKLDEGILLDEHDKGTIASYEGILKWCDGKHLQKKTIGRIKFKQMTLEEKKKANRQICQFFVNGGFI